MRQDPFVEFDSKIAKEVKKEIPKPDSSFSAGTLNNFFQNPVWVEIDNVLKFRQSVHLGKMMDDDISREEDLKRKGQFTEISFMRNIRQVFEPETIEEGEEYE